ncbi:MAG: hypothetical protein KGR98_04110 [Verrucomicrobia bacterium]|nr:hypothetical protein [Verrucomicrobiota bacterium]MDE3098032.1 hypothetical protein [Verrucomicrobiota bacterium]
MSAQEGELFGAETPQEKIRQGMNGEDGRLFDDLTSSQQIKIVQAFAALIQSGEDAAGAFGTGNRVADGMEHEVRKAQTEGIGIAEKSGVGKSIANEHGNADAAELAVAISSENDGLRKIEQGISPLVEKFPFNALRAVGITGALVKGEVHWISFLLEFLLVGDGRNGKLSGGAVNLAFAVIVEGIEGIIWSILEEQKVQKRIGFGSGRDGALKSCEGGPWRGNLFRIQLFERQYGPVKERPDASPMDFASLYNTASEDALKIGECRHRHLFP